MVAFLSHCGGSSSMLAMLEWSKRGEGEDDRVALDEAIFGLAAKATDVRKRRIEEVIEEEKRSLNFNSVCSRKCFSPFAGKESKETVSCRLANFHPRVFQ